MMLFTALLMTLTLNRMSEASSEHSGCPSGMVGGVPGDNTCYKVMTRPGFFGGTSWMKTSHWTRAWAECESEGLVLARPSDSTAVELPQKLFNYYGDVGEVWVAGRGSGSAMTWVSGPDDQRSNSGGHVVPLNLVMPIHREQSGPAWCLKLRRVSERQRELRSDPTSPYEVDECSEDFQVPVTGVLCQDRSVSDFRAPQGGWGAWTSWSTCSGRIGEHRTRTRSCTAVAPATCPGSPAELNPCVDVPLPIPVAETCGVSLSDKKVVGGEMAIAGQFPWMVHISYTSTSGKLGSCGGSLISKKLVLTAAHCLGELRRNFPVSIKIGFVNHRQQEPGTMVFIVHLDDFTIHSEYNPITLANDIALAHLPYDVEFNNRIQPICLPNNFQIPFGGKAVAAGWGIVNPLHTNIQDVLRYVQLDIVEESSCRSPGLFICAWTANKDTCKGDSGGPLMVKHGGQYVIIGVVSHGPGDCGNHPAPGKYTRVENYLPFINSGL